MVKEKDTNKILKELDKLEKFLKMEMEEWDKKGFDDYSDIEKLMEKTNLGDKEVARCDFLLKMIEEIERKINKMQNKIGGN